MENELSQLNHYIITEIIYENQDLKIVRSIRKSDKQKFLLKVCGPHSTQKDYDSIKNEYKILKQVKHEGIPLVFSLELEQGLFPFLVMEDIGGDLLTQVNNNGPLHYLKFLQIALPIVGVLETVHNADLIHGGLHPGCILLNQESNLAQIIDFHMASNYSYHNYDITQSDIHTGMLYYISPEKTGRMNQNIDYRTDFYSLGIIFYEMLTGVLPFPGDDPLEIIHGHIARVPPDPTKLVNGIPQQVSNIVMKLISKNCEDRYQSASGLLFDLRKCLDVYYSQNAITEFVLGKNDFSYNFQIPAKLYGRDKEIEIILTTFNKTITGNPQIAIITGQAGIGKTSLVQEVYKPITQKHGFFLSGKYDIYQHNIPHGAIIQALNTFIRILLTENEEKLSQWRKKIADALENNVQIMIDIIPELALITGVPSPVQQLAPIETENRFNLVFEKFIETIAQFDHPLVLFIDDLQWADSASLKTLKRLIVSKSCKYLFVILAYRDNEISPDHPLLGTIQDIIQAGLEITEIHLQTLSEPDIQDLSTQTFGKIENTILNIQNLTSLMYSKTMGNPFFVKQFLQSLYNGKYIWFNHKKRQWEFDFKRIEKLHITDNVIDLLVNKIENLPSSTRQALKNAACIGNKFKLYTVALLCQKSLLATVHDLEEAINEKIIYPSHGDYKTITGETKKTDIEFNFIHDKMQQAIYSLIPDDVKTNTNLQLGRLLMMNLSEIEINDEIFMLAHHFNCGLKLIENDAEKIQVAQLNLRAGVKAKQSTGYDLSWEFLMKGIDCLIPGSWETDYLLTFSLYKELAEIEYLIGNFSRSEELIITILDKAKTSIEKASIYNFRINQYTIKAKYVEAIQAAREALALLGVALPQKDLKEAISIETEEVKTRLSSKNIAHMVYEKNMVDPEIKAAVNVLGNVVSTAYQSNSELWTLIILKIVKFTLKYGNAPESALGYSLYALIIGFSTGDFKSAYEFSILAMEINNKFNNLSEKCKTCIVLGGTIHHWIKHIKYCPQITQEGYEAALKSGELQYAGFNIMHKLIHLFYMGTNLEKTFPEINKALLFARKSENQLAINTIIGLQQVIDYIMDNTNGQPLFHNSGITENEYIENSKKLNLNLGLAIYNILKTQTLFIHEEPAKALACIREAEKQLNSILGFYPVSQYNFFKSLCLTALFPLANNDDQKIMLKELRENQAQMQLWSDNCKDNFYHQYLLIEAELARIQNNDTKAMELYDQAIESAQHNQFIQNEALAHELAANFWIKKDKIDFAMLYIQKAHTCYNQWGAKRKLRLLENKYYSFAFQKNATISLTNNLDLNTIIKTSQAISSEIILEKLLKKIMKIIIENAGAERGYLLLDKGGKLYIEAEGNIDGEDTKILQSIKIENNTIIPLSIINYVTRTRKPVILNNALKEGDFTLDHYIISEEIKSVLCAPLINQGELIAILYLENNLATGAFTPERVELLNMISSQMAVSIENATLYLQAQEDIIERKKAENALKIALNDKDELLKELHHRVKNNMQIISSMFTLQVDKLSGTMEKNIFLDMEAKIQSIALIHELVYHSEYNAFIDFKLYLDLFLEKLHGIYMKKIINININVNSKKIILPIRKAIPCGLLIAEIMTNSLKHAFSEEDKGNISLTFTADDTHYFLTIEDDGIGIPGSIDIYTTTLLGLNTIKLLTKQLHGSFDLIRDKGAKYNFIFSK